jgi:hypothetical protein
LRVPTFCVLPLPAFGASDVMGHSFDVLQTLKTGARN